MAAVKCEICGRRILTESNNWTEKNGKYYHKKCPAKKDVLSDDEKLEYRALTDRIKYHFDNNASEFIIDKGVNYKYLTPKIKKLKEEGYSYNDQIYALDKIVEIQGGFSGFGSVVNNISRLISERDRAEKLLKEVEINKNDGEIRFNFDLGKENDYEW